MFLFPLCSRCTAYYIVIDNVKTFTSVGVSFKDVILLEKLYMFDIVNVKSNNITY